MDDSHITTNANLPDDNTITVSGGQSISSTFSIPGLIGPNGPQGTMGSAYLSNRMYPDSGSPRMTLPYGENSIIIEDETSLDVKGRIRLNGEFLDERLERIEKILNIPTRNLEMEEKYPKLKEIWELYNYTLEKYTTWENIKK